MVKAKDLRTPQEINEQLIKDYRETFNTASGKRVMEDLELRFFYRTSIVSNLEHIMTYRSGLRDAVCHIKTLVETDIKRLRELMEEMQKEQDLEPEL